jgi:hypothetical protein
VNQYYLYLINYKIQNNINNDLKKEKIIQMTSNNNDSKIENIRPIRFNNKTDSKI